MSRIVEADALKDRLSELPVESWIKTVINCNIDDMTTAGYSKAELIRLRDDLYQNDQITMKGLAKLNRLIYGVKE